MLNVDSGNYYIKDGEAMCEENMNRKCHLEHGDGKRDKIISAILRFKMVNASMNFGGITHREFFMLETLARFEQENPDKKGVYVSELSASLHIAMPQVSRMLKSMEEKNLILRVVNQDNRRNTYVSITDMGRLKRKCVKDELDYYTNTIINRMGEDKIDQMVGLVNEAIEIMKDEQSKRKETKS